MSRRRYVPPPSPGPECDTAQAVRDFYDDVACAQDEMDLRRPDPRDEA